jgi:tetratricopeptide (TPR) repeat protein
LQREDTDSALADLDASLEIVPTATESRLMRARVQVFQGDFAAALADYDRLIELQPQEATYYTERGEINVQQGLVELALADFNRAIELNPDSDQAYADRALLHQRNANLVGALEDISAAIRINPEASQYYLLRGGLHALAENTASSAGDYLRWLVLNQTRFLEAPDALTSSQAFTVEMAPGWIYVIPFEASAGQEVSIAATASQTNTTAVDPLMVILDINGDPAIGDDDSGGNFDAAISNYVAPDDGLYTLVLGHAAGGVRGDITVYFALDDLGE